MPIDHLPSASAAALAFTERENMPLNHLNLCVDDVPESVAFFETHFGFRCIELKSNDAIAVLKDISDFTLVVSNFDKMVKPAYPEAFHFGFLVDSAAEVQAIYDGLVGAGVLTQGEPRRIRGTLGFYGYAPGDVLFEVSSRQRIDV